MLEVGLEFRRQRAAGADIELDVAAARRAMHPAFVDEAIPGSGSDDREHGSFLLSTDARRRPAGRVDAGQARARASFQPSIQATPAMPAAHATARSRAASGAKRKIPAAEGT